MKATKISELDTVFEAAVKIITGPFKEELYNKTSFSKIFAPNFQAFGTYEGENYSNFDDFRNLTKLFRKKSKNNNKSLTVDNNPIFRSYSQDGKSAVYVNELKIVSGPNDVPGSGGLRISIVLFKMEQGWRVTHIHASNPTSNIPEGQLLSANEGDRKIAQMEKLLAEQNTALSEYAQKLEAIQEQLVRREKLASLGQLTAGIAHEIKNPLNFINNFSELSSEFIDEIEEIVQKFEVSEKTEEILALLEDVKENLKKIYHHGTRADGIVKSMLLHSRGGSGKMEDINLNDLIKEYVNLSFHGMRANKNPINVNIKLETDDSLGLVKINPENFSRVILNLCKNAFDAMREKQLLEGTKDYLPQLIVRTRATSDKTIVEIEDNGPGVPVEIREKMMQPFFTTKKGTDGTGLGLSISQDIIKSHGGILEIDSKEGKFTRFTILLNIA